MSTVRRNIELLAKDFASQVVTAVCEHLAANTRRPLVVAETKDYAPAIAPADVIADKEEE